MAQDQIRRLLADASWPAVDAITFGDGRMVLIELDVSQSRAPSIRRLTDTTLTSYLKESPDQLCRFDILSRAAHGKYEVCAGDTSWEGEGIVFVVERATQTLRWFAFFEISNPFHRVSVDDRGMIRAHPRYDWKPDPSRDLTWTFPIDDPLAVRVVVQPLGAQR